MDSLIKEEYSFVNNPRVDNTNSPHAKLLYSKSKVYIHPSANSQDYIPGFLSLVEAELKKEYLVAWTPEVLIPSHDLEAFVQVDNNPEKENDQVSTVLIPSSGCETSSLYAFSTPMTQIHSLVIHPPSFTKWYGSIIINFKDGHSSSPLWFHDDESNSTVLQKKTQGGKFFQNNNGDHQKIRWGGDEFMERLSTILSIEISEKDDTLYYVNENISKPKRQSASTSSSVFDSIQMDPWVASLKEVRWGILEKFSKVTQFSRNTAQQILNHQTTSSFLPSKYQNNANVRKTMDDYDSARLFLAKWAADLTKHSNQYASDEQRYRNVGLWGHQGGWDEENTDLGIFEILNSENDLSIPTHTRTSPVTMEKWNSFFDTTGKLSIGEPYVLECIFRGGLDPSIRKEAWLFLLNVFEWESTTLEREELIKTKREKYLDLKTKWKEQLSTEDAHLQDQKHRIDKDIHRTDRTTPFYAKDDLPNPDSLMNIGTNANLETLKDILYAYNIYNSELGYVQGMSDLLSPLYAVIGDEALAFWAFVGFMERTTNFLMDQSGMHQQLLTMDNLLQMMDPNLYKHFQHTDSYNLFFCFRWLLVWFKREFSWNDTLTLWEVFWTNYLTHQFHLFVALAILDQHRDVMIDYLKNFDEILKYINDLALTMDVQEILQRAEILFYQFKQRIEHLDAKKLKEKDQSLPIISPSLRDLLK
ncbi:unnamed protein product [Cunninghamella echinulata]